MKCAALNVRIFSVFDDEDYLTLNIIGGDPFQLLTIHYPMNDLALGVAEKWEIEERDLNLFVGDEGGFYLREAVVDTRPPPPTDTPASRYLDGKHQGQFDLLHLTFRHPLSAPKDQK